ncbi:MAG: hypothetical protein WCK54_00010 [Desulfuromonadales bacterium]
MLRHDDTFVVWGLGRLRFLNIPVACFRRLTPRRLDITLDL